MSVRSRSPKTGSTAAKQWAETPVHAQPESKGSPTTAKSPGMEVSPTLTSYAPFKLRSVHSRD